MDENPYAPGGVEQPEAPARQRVRGRLEAGAEGSFAVGFVLGLLFGLWAALGCWLLAKPETARGARMGLLAQLLLYVLLLGVIALLDG